MMWFDESGAWGWWLAMMLGMLAFWVIVAWAIVTLVRGGGLGRASAGNAASILGERLARGEIDEEEYRRRLAALEDRGSRV